MKKNIISVRTVVAIGIGAALFFVLFRFVTVPSGVPETDLNLGILDLLMYNEPFEKVTLQGLTAAGVNSAIVLILGSVWAVSYSKSRAKAGSPKAG